MYAIWFQPVSRQLTSAVCVQSFICHLVLFMLWGPERAKKYQRVYKTYVCTSGESGGVRGEGQWVVTGGWWVVGGCAVHTL